MDLLPVENDAQWEALLARSDHATLFHTMGWLRFLSSQYGYRLVTLVARRDVEDVGLFPLFLTRRWAMRISSSPRGIDTLFLGPLVADELLGELLDAYERWTRRHHVDYSAIAFSRLVDPAVVEQHGYHCERHRYSVVPLDGGAEATYKRFTSECRRKIRLAEKRGVEIVEGDFPAHYDRYVALSAKVFARSNLQTQLSRTALAAMIETLRGEGRLLAMRAEVEGQVAGMWIGGVFDKTMYALDTVSDRAFIHCSVNNLMNCYAIRWSCRRGLDAVDFGGSRIPSLRTFKASFGAIEHYYNNIKKPHSPVARAASRIADVTIHRLRNWRYRRSQKARVQQGPTPREPQGPSQA